MSSLIMKTKWYKNFTKGFIDTSSSPAVPKKKMPLKQDILIRANKIIDIGYITSIYFIVGAIIANTLTNLQTTFNSEEEDKKMLISCSLSLIFMVWVNGVLIYVARNLIEMIPYPFNNLFGFKHERLKEIGKATAFTFVLLYFQPNLINKMRYLVTRWENTFSGRPFLEGVKLLIKPAPVPTITGTPTPVSNKNSKNTNNNNNKVANNKRANSKKTI
jgi:hypothetical protein